MVSDQNHVKTVETPRALDEDGNPELGPHGSGERRRTERTGSCGWL